MAGSRNDIEMKVTADSRGVAAGLKPMMTSLESAQVAAQETEKALDAIGTTPIKVSVNDEAIAKARAEISRLRNQMREQLSTDVTADTREAERRIKELQRSIKVLDATDPVVEVEVNTTRLETLRTSVIGIQGALSGGAGAAAGQGLISGLSAASKGMGAMGASGAAAATGVGAVAVAAVVAADAAWNLGQMAADAETQVAQLDALTKGMGEETFGQLQEFAATTPFAVDEVTAATKRLVAAGVELEDIPDTISDLGEVAAATGVPIEQISTVFAQMVSKGKASYEELQQLAEAGVPVWQLLADKLGLTVAEVQKLATEGKLSADAIRLLQESLAQTYQGSMQRQAETFNGQMSTLKDTVSQTGQEVGTIFLPVMKDAVAVLTDIAVPALTAAHAIAEFNNKIEEGGGSLLGFIPGVTALDLLNGGLDDTGDTAEDTKGFIADLGEVGTQALADVQAQIEEDNQALADMEKLARDLEDAFQDAVAAFQGIGAGVRARVDFIIDRDDLRDEIHKAIEGTKDEAPVTLPADLKIGQVSGLTDAQQDLTSNLSAYATQGLEEGARQADIAHSLGQTFDAETFYRNLRKDLRPLVIDAGIDPQNVNQFMDNVLGVPAPWKVQPEVTGIAGAQQALDIAFPPKEVPIDVRIPHQQREAMEAAGLLGLNETGTVANITTNVEGADESRRLLDEVALPEGEDRTAWIDVKLRRSGDILSLPPASSAGDDRRAQQQEPQRAPRVQVLIDGEEVANHLRRRGTGGPAPAGRGRRMP